MCVCVCFFLARAPSTGSSAHEEPSGQEKVPLPCFLPAQYLCGCTVHLNHFSHSMQEKASLVREPHLYVNLTVPGLCMFYEEKKNDRFGNYTQSPSEEHKPNRIKTTSQLHRKARAAPQTESCLPCLMTRTSEPTQN